jgi:hypothetical protein
MQMRHEHDAQLERIEPGDAAIDQRGFRAPHDTRTEIDQVRRVVDDDCGRGAGAVRIDGRSRGAKQHDLRLLSASRANRDEHDQDEHGVGDAHAQNFPCKHCSSPPIPAASLGLSRHGRNLNGRASRGAASSNR